MLCRYIPEGISTEKLAELERWRCDSRTAACACLLLLCATRETLSEGGDALHLANALTEVCSALGRHSGHDSMVWGCDLDPGSCGAQTSAPAGARHSLSRPSVCRGGRTGLISCEYSKGQKAFPYTQV